MEIKPTYRTLEQSKLLAKKGFNSPTYGYYDVLNICVGKYENHSQTTTGDTPIHTTLIGYISALEQWQVVEWLRQKHGIWVAVTINGLDKLFNFDIHNYKQKGSLGNIQNGGFKTPQEAYDAAFDYILNNVLI